MAGLNLRSKQIYAAERRSRPANGQQCARMWASRSPEEHSLIQSRRHAGLEPDQFGIRERSFGSADGLAEISDDETFDRVDEPLRFATRVEKKEAESIEYRCAPTLATAQRPSAHPMHPLQPDVIHQSKASVA